MFEDQNEEKQEVLSYWIISAGGRGIFSQKGQRGVGVRPGALVGWRGAASRGALSDTGMGKEREGRGDNQLERRGAEPKRERRRAADRL